MIQGAILPIRGMMVDCAGELSDFIMASNALLRSSSRDLNASKLYPNPVWETRSESGSRTITGRAMAAWEEGEAGMELTCKSDDV